MALPDIRIPGNINLLGEQLAEGMTSEFPIRLNRMMAELQEYARQHNIALNDWRALRQYLIDLNFEAGGPSAFEAWQMQPGNAGKAFAVYFDSIRGAAGPSGPMGQNNYQLWIVAGNSGSLEDYLETLRGPAGSGGSTPILNTLSSTSATSALAADRGRVLDEKIAAVNSSLFAPRWPAISTAGRATGSDDQVYVLLAGGDGGVDPVGGVSGSWILVAAHRSRTAVTFNLYAAQPDGTIFTADGLDYEVDSTVSVADSAGFDLGVAGIKPFGYIRLGHVSSELGTIATDTAALKQVGRIFGDKIIDKDVSVDAQIDVSAEGNWFFAASGKVTQTALNTALFKHADGLAVTWVRPKLRGYGALDTASIRNNKIFTTEGLAIGLWFRQADGFNIVDPDIHNFRNAGIGRVHCSNSYVTGVMNIKGTLPGDPLENPVAADGVTPVPVTFGQQFGVIDYAQSYLTEGSVVNLQNTGTPHGNKNVGIKATGTIEDTAIAYCCFPGFENVLAEGYATKNLTQHASYMYAGKGAVARNIRADAGSTGVKFSIKTTNGMNPTGCRAENITGVNGDAQVVLFETHDYFVINTAGDRNPDSRQISRWHFVSPVISNIQCENWNATPMILMHCRDAIVNGVVVSSIGDVGLDVEQAIELVNCSGTFGSLNISNVPRRSIKARPHMFGTIVFNGMNKITEPCQLAPRPVIEVQEASDMFEWYPAEGGMYLPENFIFRTPEGRYYKVITAGLSDPTTAPSSTNSAIGIAHGTSILHYMGLSTQVNKGGRVSMVGAFDIDLGLQANPNHLLYCGPANSGLTVDWSSNVARKKAGGSLPPVTIEAGMKGEFEEVVIVDVGGTVVNANGQSYVDSPVSDALKISDEIVSAHITPTYDFIEPSVLIRGASGLRVIMRNITGNNYTIPAGRSCVIKILRKA